METAREMTALKEMVNLDYCFRETEKMAKSKY